MWKTMSSNPMPRSALSFAFFASQSKYFTGISGYHDVCLIGTHWYQLQCARQCAQTRSEDRQTTTNANQRINKNWPEIVNFRPVL
jgi:hypothetical protein